MVQHSRSNIAHYIQRVFKVANNCSVINSRAIKTISLVFIFFTLFLATNPAHALTNNHTNVPDTFQYNMYSVYAQEGELGSQDKVVRGNGSTCQTYNHAQYNWISVGGIPLSQRVTIQQGASSVSMQLNSMTAVCDSILDSNGNVNNRTLAATVVKVDSSKVSNTAGVAMSTSNLDGSEINVSAANANSNLRYFKNGNDPFNRAFTVNGLNQLPVGSHTITVLATIRPYNVYIEQPNLRCVVNPPANGSVGACGNVEIPLSFTVEVKGGGGNPDPNPNPTARCTLSVSPAANLKKNDTVTLNWTITPTASSDSRFIKITAGSGANMTTTFPPLGVNGSSGSATAKITASTGTVAFTGTMSYKGSPITCVATASLGSTNPCTACGCPGQPQCPCNPDPNSGAANICPQPVGTVSCSVTVDPVQKENEDIQYTWSVNARWQAADTIPPMFTNLPQIKKTEFNNTDTGITQWKTSAGPSGDNYYLLQTTQSGSFYPSAVAPGSDLISRLVVKFTGHSDITCQDATRVTTPREDPVCSGFQQFSPINIISTNKKLGVSRNTGPGGNSPGGYLEDIYERFATIPFEVSFKNGSKPISNFSSSQVQVLSIQPSKNEFRLYGITGDRGASNYTKTWNIVLSELVNVSPQNINLAPYQSVTVRFHIKDLGYGWGWNADNPPFQRMQPLKIEWKITGVALNGGDLICPGGTYTPTPEPKVNRPALQVNGSDTYAGATFSSQARSCDVDRAVAADAKITTNGYWEGFASPGYSDVTKYGSSGAQYAAFAAKQIGSSGDTSNNFAANNALAVKTNQAVQSLVFSNNDPTAGYGNYMNQAALPCIDISATEAAVTANAPVGTDFSSLIAQGGTYGNAQYIKRSGDLVISGNTVVPNKTKKVIIVDGSVTIDGNISYLNKYASAEDIPYLKIIAKNGIFIRSSASTLAGQYISFPGSGQPTAGVIDTCYDAAGTTPAGWISTGLSLGSCPRQLVVQGSLLAKRILWKSTYGTVGNSSNLAQASQCAVNQKGINDANYVDRLNSCAAERIDFNAEAYLADPTNNATNVGSRVINSIELPPIY